MTMTTLARLARLAANQDGLISAAQAESASVDRRVLARARSTGVIDRVHPDVWRFAAVPLTDRQRIRAAVLQLGDPSAASHESSLHLHGQDRLPFVVAATVPPASTHLVAGVRVHRLCDLRDEHRTVIDGIPTTTLPRAVVDCASVFSRARLDHLLDRVTITDRATSLGAIARVLRQVNRRGRRNIATLQELLDARGPGTPTPRSKLERLVDDLLTRTDLPEPLAEHPLPGIDPGGAFVDRAWPEAMLILEIDGRTWHSRERDMARDRARDRAASRAGWLTLRVLDEEVGAVPDAVVDDIVTTYRQRLAQLGSN